MHPTAQVTVTDIEPTSVAAIAAGDLGSHPRATVREMDATAIDAPDGYYDLAVFALSFHHLPPRPAARVFAEGTRAADKLLIIDFPRWRSPLQAVRLVLSAVGRWFRPATMGSSARCVPTARLRCGHWPGTPTRRSPLICTGVRSVPADACRSRWPTGKTVRSRIRGLQRRS
jgi:methyltransferase family protein